MSDAEFMIRWWITFQGPPAALLDRAAMVDLLLAARGEAPGEPSEARSSEARAPVARCRRG